MLLRRMLIMLGVVLVVVLALAAYKGFSIYQQIQMFSAPQPAISVSAARAEEQPWQGRLPAIGTLKAFQGVDLAAEVSLLASSKRAANKSKSSDNSPISSFCTIPHRTA